MQKQPLTWIGAAHLGVGVGLLGTASRALAQEYLQADTPAMTTLTEQNVHIGGQIPDLIFKLTNVQWITHPCPADPTKLILDGVKADLELDWVLPAERSWFGIRCRQAEGHDNTDGDDFFTFQWNGPYVLVSATRDGQSIIEGPNPQAQQGGNGTWNGVRVAPPGGFESGDERPLVYTFTWEFVPPPGCQVYPLYYQGAYLHTYDGDPHFSWGQSLSVGPSYPWGVSVGAEFSATNDHAWQAQLVSPGSNGGKHVGALIPPSSVSRESCCAVTTPPGEPNSPDGAYVPDPSPAQRDELVVVDYVGGDADSGVRFIELRAVNATGDLIAACTTPFVQPCHSGCAARLTFTVPHTFDEPSIRITALVADNAGNTHAADVDMPVSNPLYAPILGAASNLPDGRLLAPDQLFIGIQEWTPGTTGAQVSNRVRIKVLDQAGAVIDKENSLPFAALGNLRFACQVPVLDDRAFINNNGILSARNTDAVHVTYLDNDEPATTSILPVVPHPDAIVVTAASQAGGPFTRFAGAAVGGGLRFRIDGQPIDVPTSPADTGQVVAARVANLVNASGLAGVSAQVVGADGVRLAGAGRIALGRFDQGMFMARGQTCYADCDESGALNVNDYICFQTRFALGEPYADCDGNGVRNVNDYICFQTRFALGCS